MRVLELFLTTMLAATCCFAQSDSITIGPGDTVQIRVLEAPELNQTARVTDSGMFPLIIGGNVHLGGLTTEEAAVAVEHALEVGRYMLSPHVSVTISQSATQDVTVIGAVKLPGVYPIGTPRSILDILALAGGETELASTKITIERHSSDKKVQYNLSNHPDIAFDDSVLVYPGDKVFVPKVDVVYVLGDVGHPGGYPMETNDSKMSLLQAIAHAGGTLPTAVPSHARLIRKLPNGTYVEMHLQLSAMQKGKIADISLQHDDIIYIPFSYLRSMALNLNGIIAAAASASVYRY